MAQFSDVARLTRALNASPLWVGKITVGAGLEKNNKTTAVTFAVKKGASYLLCSGNGSYSFLCATSPAAAGAPGGSSTTADASANGTNPLDAQNKGVPMAQSEKVSLCLSGAQDLISVYSTAGCDVQVWELRDN